jgi:hypothetical protein
MSDTLTLGPLTLALPLRHGAALIVDGNGTNVAVCLGGIDTSENTARLFAASPDLLLAADAAVESHAEYGHIGAIELTALRTAIARARGQG